MTNRLIVKELSDCEPADWTDAWVTDDERAAAAGFAPHRRREYLTWRAVVRRELGRDTAITYAANGAPQVGGGAFISVSHSKNIVAVCIGDTPCAVDTEPLDRNFDRVRRRYMTAAEEALSDDVRLAAAVWCAKEALYKLHGREGCDFLRDIRIESVDFGSGSIAGSIHDSGTIELSIEYFGDNIVVRSN